MLNFISGGGHLTSEDVNKYLKQAEGLMEKGFAKWETLEKQPRNILSGVAIVIGCLALPKALFVLATSSLFAGRHMYLREEIKDDTKFEFEDTDLMSDL